MQKRSKGQKLGGGKCEQRSRPSRDIGDIRECEKTPRRIGNFQESGKDVGFLGVVFVPG
jgi:hypothetical protein